MLCQAEVVCCLHLGTHGKCQSAGSATASRVAGGRRARQLVWLDGDHVLLVAQCTSLPPPDGAAAAKPHSSIDELLVIGLTDGSIQSGKLCWACCESCAALLSTEIASHQAESRALGGGMLDADSAGHETGFHGLQRCSCRSGSRCCGHCRRRVPLRRCCSCRTAPWWSSVMGRWCGLQAAASRRPARSWPAYQPAQQVGIVSPVACTVTWSSPLQNIKVVLALCCATA
jgi:hypothetical protein